MITYVASNAPWLVNAVPTAPPGADGQHCSKSPMSIHDPLAGPNNEVEDIIGIGKVMMNGQVVGFIYRTASGRFYAQALASMSYRDQIRAGLVVASKAALEKPHGELYSVIKQISRFPWPNLKLVPCR